MSFQDQQRMSVQESVLLGFITSCVGSLVVSLWYLYSLSGQHVDSSLEEWSSWRITFWSGTLRKWQLRVSSSVLTLPPSLLNHPCPRCQLFYSQFTGVSVHTDASACLLDCGSAVSAHTHLQNYTRGQWTGNPVRVICFLWKRAPQHFFSENRRGPTRYGMPWILPYVSRPAVPAYWAVTYGLTATYVLNIQLLVHYWFVLGVAKWHWCNVTATCTAQQLFIQSLIQFYKTPLSHILRHLHDYAILTED